MSLEPLCCAACGAALPAPDAAEVRCPFCSAVRPVPDAHREAVRLLRGERAGTATAEAAWREFQRGALPWGLAVAVAFLPSLALFVGLGAGLLAQLGVIVVKSSPAALVAWLGWLPLDVAVPLATLAYWYSDFRASRLAAAQVGLAAGAAATEAGPVGCRRCGAPLDVTPDDTFVRCIYCQTDSLVTLGAVRARALAKTVEALEADASSALAAIRKRRETGFFSAAMVALIWLGLSALPLLWSFLVVFRRPPLVVLVWFDVLALTLYATGITVGSLVFRRTPSVAKGHEVLLPWLAALGLFTLLAARVA